jgi:adenine/guanine phosphoribosyltransferase-like PRPP-binding protein
VLTVLTGAEATGLLAGHVVAFALLAGFLMARRDA